MNQWHETRIIECARKIETACQFCGQKMWLPPSKAKLYRSCSTECAKAYSAAQRLSRQRQCETCGTAFIPRARQLAMGQGRYCSQRCNSAGLGALNRPEIKVKAKDGHRLLREQGLFKINRGADNPKWLGGPEALKLRNREKWHTQGGKEKLRAYRAANPDKQREYKARRDGRKVGTLPRGTIKKIGRLQSWRCAICRIDVRRRFHMDHIVPLARGGTHEPRNLQLLCPPCNLSKSSRDPIEHMQSLGRLL